MLHIYFPWKRRLLAKNHWKPLTLKIPILGSFILTSLSIIVILEILSQKSLKKSNGGGVAFASQDGGIPSAVSFGFLYVPTIVAVFYSMIWSWVDLDVKRLEPWFQLSAEDGASAEDSLLLQYPFDFLPFIPITALRRRHWAVFFAGVVMLLIFWVVTPLQSAIFNTGIATRLSNIYVGTSAVLTPLSLQSIAMNSKFMTIAYNIIWLGQTLPPSTTYDYAFLPFRPIPKTGELAIPSSDGTWSTTVEAFSTNITCYPAEVTTDNVTYTFSNGKGCTVGELSFMSGPADFFINYIGYYSNAQSDWWLQNPNCSANFGNSFLAMWASTSSRVANGIYSNLTALFCETSYTSQTMQVLVNSSTQSVDAGFSTGKMEPSTNLSTIFNTTNFEYLLSAGVPSTAQTQKGNLIDTHFVDQSSHITNSNIVWPVSNMVGFALGLNDFPLDHLHDPLILSRFFEKAHQVLFSAAFSTLTESVNASIPTTKREGLFKEKQEAIILVRPIALTVEITLGLISILSYLLWAYTHSRPSLLPFDPSSIADIMSLAPGTDETLDAMKNEGNLTAPKLERILSHKKYYLCPSETGLTSIRSQPLSQTDRLKYQSRLQSSKKPHQESPLPIRPVELSTVFGAVFICTMIFALVGLLFLYVWSEQRGGITLPTTNAVVRSIIENYAPTMLATLIEPVWTILNRLLCLLQPFEALREGRAKPSRSVDARYTSLPPQLSFWRAVKARHFLLATVCLTAVSSNILAITLSALFNESPATIEVNITSGLEYQSRFNGSLIFDTKDLSGAGAYTDHFFVAMSNIVSGTALPAWVDKDFFYLPFKLEYNPSTQSNKSELQGFSGSTIGFGVNTTCTQLPSSSNTDTLQFAVNSNGTSFQQSITHRTTDGTLITCAPPTGIEKQTIVDTGAFVDGAQALEITYGLEPASGTDDGGLCATMPFIGWIRATSDPANRNITSTFLSCTQQLLVADFKIVVDHTGRVVTSNRTSDFAKDTSQYFTPNATLPEPYFSLGAIKNETALFQHSNALINDHRVLFDYAWHNDSFSIDWINSLLGLMTNSTDLVNPNVKVPAASTVKPLVETLYQQLFVLLLALNAPHMFSPAENTLDPRANAIFVETRIFLSTAMFAACVSVLSFQILVAILYYLYRPQRFLSRMPTSIASVLAFAAGSRAMEDFRTIDRGKIHEGKHLYGYGRFVGTDGKTHVGIERQRYVVPLKSKNPEVRRRKWKLWSKRDEKQPKTWI